jgi:Fe-S cluster assembly ATPase SufC
MKDKNRGFRLLVKMLNIKNLSVKIDDKVILQDVSLNFEVGKNYCLLGKNGS